METYQIILLIITSIVVLAVGIWYIIQYLKTPHPKPQPNPDPNGGGGGPTKSHNWPRTKEVFFISITAPKSVDMVDQGNWFSQPGPFYQEYIAQELKPAFYKRHYFYNIASISDIKTACQQGFNPPGPQNMVKSGQYFSTTFNPTNIMLMTVQQFTTANSQFPVGGFGTSLQNNLQIVSKGKAYDIIQSPGDTSTYCGPGTSNFTNCLYPGAQLTSPLQLNSPCPKVNGLTSQSITYPVVGYKPSQELNTTNSNHVLQSTFIDPTYTQSFSLEIVPYSPDSWYYQPNDPTGKVYYTGGMEMMVFKIDTTKVQTVPGNPGYFQIWQGPTGSHISTPPNMRYATLDDLEYSFSKGYNRPEYIQISQIMANVVTDKSNPAKYGINLYKLGANIPPITSLPYSAGQYSGLVLDPTRESFPDPSTDPQIIFDSCNNPQPPDDKYIYLAFWGIKPDQTTWIQTLLSPKAQTFAPTYIDLLPFTVGSTNWLTKMLTGTAEKWSMYS